MRNQKLLTALGAVLALVVASCGDGKGALGMTPEAAAGVGTTMATVASSLTTTTTTVPAETTTTTSTTTTLPPTTTTPTTTTEVLPDPSIVEIVVDGESIDCKTFTYKMGPAPIGLLVEPLPAELSDDTWAGVSACLLEVIEREMEILGEVYTVYFLKFFFGEQSVTGEQIVGELFLGIDIEIDGVSWLVFDPPDSPFASGNLYSSSIPVGDFIEHLEIHHLYPIKLVMDLVAFGIEPPDDCDQLWRCRFFVGDLLNPEVHDALGYDQKIYEALIGEGDPPKNGFGYVFQLDLVPAYSPPEE